jgi:hypothetical protein
MSITSSVVTVESVAQRDGRRWVREVHSDGQGVAAIIDYLGASDASSTAQGIANTRATSLNVSLGDAEFAAKRLINASPLPLRWQTGAQLLARIRAAYRQYSQAELARLARWVLARIVDGTVTDLQLQNAFGLTGPQWVALKARMQTLADDQTAIDAAVGE